MADFTPKKEAGKAKGSIGAPESQHEHMSPPTVHLQDHHIGELFKGKLPSVGSKIKISAVAHVGASSENQDMGDGGKARRNMTLHFHKMDVGSGTSTDTGNEFHSLDIGNAESRGVIVKAAGRSNCRAGSFVY